MKKRNLIERRRALKEAYYNELRKQGVIDTPKEKTLNDMTKKELVELALNEGLELNNKLTKAVMIQSINEYREKKAEEEAELKRLEEEKQVLLNELRDMQELTEENFAMSNEELKALIEDIKEEVTEEKQDADSQENEFNGEQDADIQEEPPADGTIEDIDVPEITEEDVQAVANVIVEQSEEENKTIEQVVNEIVKEGAK